MHRPRRCEWRRASPALRRVVAAARRRLWARRSRGSWSGQAQTAQYTRQVAQVTHQAALREWGGPDERRGSDDLVSGRPFGRTVEVHDFEVVAAGEMFFADRFDGRDRRG